MSNFCYVDELLPFFSASDDNPLQSNLVFKSLLRDKEISLKEYFEKIKDEAPYDKYLMLILNIILGEYFSLDIPKQTVTLTLDSLVLVRIFLKVGELKPETKAFINRGWKKLEP